MKSLKSIFSNLFSKDTGEKNQEDINQPEPKKELQAELSNEISEEETKDKLWDFNFARDYLAVRIYPEDFVDKFQLEEFVYRVDLEKTITMLVLDLPYSVESVLQQQASEWKITTDELFKIAIANLQEHYRPDLERTNQNIIAFKGDNFFLTSNILYFTDYPECIGTYGSLVALPNREVLICKPIENDIDVEVGLQVMIPFVNEIFEHEQGRISGNVYWYYQGKFELIFSTIGLSRFNYVLPTDLENMLY
ncbi:MAG: hypothetical protein ACK40G_10495 [Cytophagaceae bacterium]